MMALVILYRRGQLSIMLQMFSNYFFPDPSPPAEIFANAIFTSSEVPSANNCNFSEPCISVSTRRDKDIPKRVYLQQFIYVGIGSETAANARVSV